MRQCERGHFYDETRHDSCPYCEGANQAAIGRTVAAQVAAQAGSLGKTVPLQENPNAAIGAAVGPRVGDAGKTVGFFEKDIGIDPTVGFLVCISGPHRGEDFRLRSGRNFIGREPRMDIALADDAQVSRENHAMVSYDGKHNAFMLSPGMGRGLTYLNTRQIEIAEPLNAYDVIEVGESRLMFLPLCGEHFSWEDRP